MRTVYTYALICCALLVANACVAYVWWQHVGGWAVNAEPSPTVAATIKASHDIEQLRTTATILAKGRSQLAHDAEALAARAVEYVIAVSLGGALFVALIARAAIRELKKGRADA
jgi:hypothetical protein